MLDVRENGLVAARHLRGEIYEVRAAAVSASHGLLVAEEGNEGRVPLGLHALARDQNPPPWS